MHQRRQRLIHQRAHQHLTKKRPTKKQKAPTAVSKNFDLQLQTRFQDIHHFIMYDCIIHRFMLKALRIFGQIFLFGHLSQTHEHAAFPIGLYQYLYLLSYYIILYHIISYCITLVIYFVSYHILLYCTILHYTVHNMYILYCIHKKKYTYIHIQVDIFNGSFILRHLGAKQLRKKPEAVAPWFNERVKSSEIGIVMDLSTLTQFLFYPLWFIGHVIMVSSERNSFNWVLSDSLALDFFLQMALDK